MENIEITFLSPRDFGFDMTRWKEPSCFDFRRRLRLGQPGRQYGRCHQVTLADVSHFPTNSGRPRTSNTLLDGLSDVGRRQAGTGPAAGHLVPPRSSGTGAAQCEGIHAVPRLPAEENVQGVRRTDAGLNRAVPPSPGPARRAVAPTPMRSSRSGSGKRSQEPPPRACRGPQRTAVTGGCFSKTIGGNHEAHRPVMRKKERQRRNSA